MRTSRVLFLALALAALPGRAAAPGDGERWWSHVRYLASDALQGRDTGSPGYREAAAYVEKTLRAAGVRPAGTAGYEQPIRFRSRRVVEERSHVALRRGGEEEPLAFGDDVVAGARAEGGPVDAPVVFVGWGVSAPEEGHDDLAGLDLRGKIAMFISGSPPELSPEVSAHAGSSGERWKALRAAGAVGEISVANPKKMESPWARRALSRKKPAMELADPALDDLVGERISLSVNPASADKFFEGSPHPFAEIVELATAKKTLPRFALPVTLHADVAIESTDVESFNVVGVLPGSDPRLAKEYVALSAHLDHVGVGAPIAGDSIYNGAMDNASGCAALLDFAQELHERGERPRRSILWVFVTGEEKGLLGSRWFGRHPTVPIHAIVADLNIDMFLPLFPLKLVTVLGLEESTLGDVIRRVAAEQGIAVQRDPEPDRHVFVRSDQYNFVREGVPAIMVDVAAPPGTPEAATLKRWLAERYHAPSDDDRQPIDLASAASYERLLFGVARAVADGDARPEWKPDSYFRRFASR
ncbi:MAG TPA: M28 family peptidase [Thermoanaerobaculia bacterium]|nr:M28 family peptidase [Thermoanaerobaculia bacterium]